MLCAILVICAVFACAVGELTPVVFLPGYFGSQLFATVAEEQYLPQSCANSSVHIPIGVPFSTLYNVTLIAKARDCLWDLMRLDFTCDDHSGICDFVPLPGITVSVNDFGGFKGIEPVYASFPRLLESWGYTPGVNMFGAPYDYRFMSSKQLTSSGLVQQLKGLIEQAYTLSGNRKVVLLGHSNGGPTMYSFFTEPEQTGITQEWKDKYVAAMIGLSGT
jgi:hypothetical protein